MYRICQALGEAAFAHYFSFMMQFVWRGFLRWRGWAFCVGLCLASVPLAAYAACTDVAQEGVDWKRCYFDGQDLHGANLTKAQLRDATFQRAELDGADFSEAHAYRAKFISTSLKEARFERANLQEADFTKADLTGASLKNADLRRAKLFHASLRGADLTGARLEGADFLGADLSLARWSDGKRICVEGSIGQCN